ncbi:Uma2 family endonuclease [Desulfonema magnum]|uniref:DUF820 n=1 Tax=Desulfonema magnum TaxID=45655 RepID=A0A975BV22_9BACT|nr:Uma2 family endonuclease [Desulfonema magnum]QTA92153.1 DUF820 [Desulfonema magnum]
MLQPEKKMISPEEYFKMEQTSEYKSEYYQGDIFAMSGASVNHNLIVSDVITALNTALRGSDCVVFPSDIKVQADELQHYTYPDISVVCGDIEFIADHDDIIVNPVVIVEVLSESTADYDRGSKFKAYRKISSLRNYILIDQYGYSVENFFKNKEDKWELEEFENLNEVVKIKSVGVELSLENIYYHVHF